MDSALARLMVRAKDTIPQLKKLWLFIWRHEVGRVERAAQRRERNASN